MKSRWLLVGMATVAVGCVTSRPPPRVQAAAVVARCGDYPGAADARIVGSKNVDHVEPLYAIVDSTPNGMESRLIGAKVHLRTIDGVTAESVGHALTCHAAREALSDHLDVGDSCPYAVPGVWVDIDVKADGLGYNVSLRGQDFDEARQILTRARAFAVN